MGHGWEPRICTLSTSTPASSLTSLATCRGERDYWLPFQKESWSASLSVSLHAGVCHNAAGSSGASWDRVCEACWSAQDSAVASHPVSCAQQGLDTDATLTASSMDSPCSMKPERHVRTGPLRFSDLGRPKRACSPSTDSTNMIACIQSQCFTYSQWPAPKYQHDMYWSCRRLRSSWIARGLLQAMLEARESRGIPQGLS